MRSSKGLDSRLVWLSFAPAGALLAGCHGGEFVVESPLSSTQKLVVDGKLGINGANCPQNADSPPVVVQGLAAGEGATVRIGGFEGTAGGVERNLTSAPLFHSSVAADYEKFVGTHPWMAAVPDTAKLDEALRAVGGLAGSAQETVTFSFFGSREKRTVFAVCVSAEKVYAGGYFDGPHFDIVCRIVSSADGVPRDLVATGSGTWANPKFSGELRTPGASASVFASQNVSVMGAGMPRGFDIHDPTRRQVGALSLWDRETSDGKTVLPSAWVLPRIDKGFEDAIYATLGIAFIYPWPSNCDQGAIAAKGGVP